MPRVTHATIDHEVDAESGPRVTPHLDQVEDPDQLIAILEDHQVRFYQFKAGAQELKEIQVDPEIDSVDRLLDTVAPVSVDELRGRVRDAVQMVLLINSANMPEDTAQIVLDCMREIKEFDGHVIAYGGGNVRSNALIAWSSANERYSVQGTNYTPERNATRVFDNLSDMCDHFKSTTGWRTSDQGGPIEDFWEGVSQVLEEKQMRRAMLKAWTQVMNKLHLWLSQTDPELLERLVDWQRGPSIRDTRSNERSKVISDTVSGHLLQMMKDIDENFYDELSPLLQERRDQMAVGKLMREVLERLACSEESLFNETLLNKLRGILDGDMSSPVDPGTGVSEPISSNASIAVSSQKTVRGGKMPRASREQQAPKRRLHREPTRRVLNSSHLRRMGRWAVAAAFLAAPVATFHSFFGLNREGVSEFVSAIVDSVANHEDKNPFPFLESRLPTKPSNSGKVATSSIPRTVSDVDDRSETDISKEIQNATPKKLEPCVNSMVDMNLVNADPAYALRKYGTPLPRFCKSLNED